jgi:hypothetical protein
MSSSKLMHFTCRSYHIVPIILQDSLLTSEFYRPGTEALKGWLRSQGETPYPISSPLVYHTPYLCHLKIMPRRAGGCSWTRDTRSQLTDLATSSFGRGSPCWTARCQVRRGTVARELNSWVQETENPGFQPLVCNY